MVHVHTSSRPRFLFLCFSIALFLYISLFEAALLMWSSLVNIFPFHTCRVLLQFFPTTLLDHSLLYGCIKYFLLLLSQVIIFYQTSTALTVFITSLAKPFEMFFYILRYYLSKKSAQSHLPSFLLPSYFVLLPSTFFFLYFITYHDVNSSTTTILIVVEYQYFLHLEYPFHCKKNTANAKILFTSLMCAYHSKLKAQVVRTQGTNIFTKAFFPMFTISWYRYLIKCCSYVNLVVLIAFSTCDRNFQ